MAQIRQTVLILGLVAVLWNSAAGGNGPRFFPDDPIQRMPAPLPVTAPVTRKVDPFFDFFVHSSTSKARPAIPAGAVNTLGEVPDSEWFTNRHGRLRMNRHELQQGPGSAEAPAPPYKVTGGKDEGLMPGIRLEDSEGRHYFVKGDPVGHPEMATAVEVIVSRFLYAIGYNTPKNDIVELKLADLRLSPKARITGRGGRLRAMTWKDIEEFVKQISKGPDNSFRIVASRAVDGDGIGPFKYEGTRSDDPNDITPHENRRDLRGLYVFSAWLNHTDAKAGNTLDTIVEEHGKRFIHHYLIDFGSALGSDGDKPKDARFGHEFMLPTPANAAKQILTLGLPTKSWERVDFPKLRGIGNFDSQSFDPDRWTSNYPNPAFLSRLPDDDFWAAKQVMAFTDDDIRAIVETGRYSDAPSAEYMIATLAERRNKIGRTFFSKILPLDRFRIEREMLLFDDLAVAYGFSAPRAYSVQWFRFSNIDQARETIADAESPQLPVEAIQASAGSYFSAVIHVLGDRLKPVSIYLRKEETGYKVVGIDRMW